MSSTESLLQEVLLLEPLQRIRVSINSSLKYGVIVGALTAISGTLGGPVGLAIGGMISSCVAGLMSQGKVQSVPYILLYETTREQKEKLLELLWKYLNSKHIMTLSDFLIKISTDASIQNAIVDIIISFVCSEFAANVTIKR